LPAAFAAFHRALAAAAIFALDAALIFLLGFRPGLADTALPYFAHLALAAAAIAARPARLILCFFLGFPVFAAGVEAPFPSSSLILSCRASIFSLMFAALRSAFGVNAVMVMVEAVWMEIRKRQARFQGVRRSRTPIFFTRSGRALQHQPVARFNGAARLFRDTDESELETTRLQLNPAASTLTLLAPPRILPL
jgi:hypothetical protein